MSSQGPNLPTTAADVSGVGTVTWSNPANVELADGSYATCTLNSAQVSHYIKASAFGFSVPSGSLVLGVMVTVNGFNDKSSAFLSNLRLVMAGTITGSVRSNPTPWSNTALDFSVGGASDIWGLTTLTAADVNDSGFGVAFSVTNGGASSDKVSVDYVRVTVFYVLTQAMGTSQSQSMSLKRQVRRSQQVLLRASTQLPRVVSKRKTITQHVSAQVTKRASKKVSASTSVSVQLLLAGHSKDLSVILTQASALAAGPGRGRIMVASLNQKAVVTRRATKRLTVFVSQIPNMARRRSAVLSVTLLMDGNKTGLFPSDFLYPSDSLFPSDSKTIFLMTLVIRTKRITVSQTMAPVLVKTASRTIHRLMISELEQEVELYERVGLGLVDAVELLEGVDLSPVLSETRG